MERVGTVIEEKGEKALVRMRRHVACENCGRCGGLLGQADRRDHMVEVLNPIGAEVGQKVLIQTDDRRMLFVSFMLYMVPLLALIAGVLFWISLAGYLNLSGPREPVAVAVGFGFMGLVFWGLRRWDNRVKDRNEYKPVIIGLAPEDQ